MSATKHEANNNKSKKQENTLKEISKEIYDKKKVKDVVKYLIENCFFTIGNLLFRQSIGMLMGPDPAPFSFLL